MPDEALDRLRADHDELAARGSGLESFVLQRLPALEREMRAGFHSINLRFDAIKADFAGVHGRLDGLEAEMRFGFEKLDRLESRVDSIDSRLANIEKMLAKALNGGERR
jgi:predicted nuclease with TOPRIM domain